MDKKTIEVALKLKDELSKGFKKVVDNVSSGSKQMTVETDKSAKSFGNLANAVKTFVALAAVREAVLFFKSCALEAANAERAFNQLSFAYENTGRVFQEMEVRKFAADLQQLVAVDDDAVIATQALLANMTDLNEEGIKEAAKLAIGLSKVFGEDLLSTAQTLAMYMETGMTRAVRRFGLSVDEDAADPVARLNSLLDDSKKMMEQAAAISNDTVGANQRLANSFNDLKQSIGDGVNPVLNDMKISLTDTLEVLTNFVNKLNSIQYFSWFNKSSGKGRGGGGGGGWGGDGKPVMKPTDASAIGLIPGADTGSGKKAGASGASAIKKEIEDVTDGVTLYWDRVMAIEKVENDILKTRIAGKQIIGESVNLLAQLQKVSIGISNLPSYPAPAGGGMMPAMGNLATGIGSWWQNYQMTQHPSYKTGKAFAGIYNWLSGGKGKSSTSDKDSWTNLGMQFIGNVAQGGSVRDSIAGSLPGVGGMIGTMGTMTAAFGALGGPIGMLAGSLLGGLFGKKRRGTTPAEPVYTSDVNLQNSMTELLNAVKSNLAMSAGAGINRISGQLRAQATAMGAI